MSDHREPNQHGWNLDHSYSQLPELFFKRTNPARVRKPSLIAFNDSLAEMLGLNAEVLHQDANSGWFAGNVLPPGANPIAQAYAGHQYGHFTTLGDGRAILLGEQVTPLGQRFDIQLKGSGRTPFSRGGDGLAAVGPMLREYLISESMHALGIPTTRSLAVTSTGEKIIRNAELPGAVLTRVAASHIRVGTFQWAAAHEDHVALGTLAEYTRRRHFPDLAEASHLDFFHAVMDRQASLIAKWLNVGFVHGVMNTDNMALSGETIDYGPCAFLDTYDPSTTFSSIDHYGRYAYSQQPAIARWNLARLAEAMLPLFHDDEKQAVDAANHELHQFQDIFQTYWLKGMRAKLGIFNSEPEDHALARQLLDNMEAVKMDFTLTFRALCSHEVIDHAHSTDPGFVDWHAAWKARLSRQAQSMEETIDLMSASNPVVIPRNHRVEDALSAATQGDLSLFQRLLAAIIHPFDSPLDPADANPPSFGSPPYVTFCGT